MFSKHILFKDTFVDYVQIILDSGSPPPPVASKGARLVNFAFWVLAPLTPLFASLDVDDLLPKDHRKHIFI